jgi:hypothetical protein
MIDALWAAFFARPCECRHPGRLISSLGFSVFGVGVLRAYFEAIAVAWRRPGGESEPQKLAKQAAGKLASQKGFIGLQFRLPGTFHGEVSQSTLAFAGHAKLLRGIASTAVRSHVDAIFSPKLVFDAAHPIAKVLPAAIVQRSKQGLAKGRWELAVFAAALDEIEQRSEFASAVAAQCPENAEGQAELGGEARRALAAEIGNLRTVVRQILDRKRGAQLIALVELDVAIKTAAEVLAEGEMATEGGTAADEKWIFADIIGDALPAMCEAVLSAWQIVMGVRTWERGAIAPAFKVECEAIGHLSSLLLQILPDELKVMCGRLRPWP